MEPKFRYICLCFVITTLSLLLNKPLLIAAPGKENILTSEAIRELVNGRTSEVTITKTEMKGFCYFSPDGAYTQLINNWLESGVWTVNKKDRLCISISREKPKCRILLLTKDDRIDQYIAKKNGNHKLERKYGNFILGNKIFELAALSEPPREKLKKEEIIKIFADRTVLSKTVRKGRVSLTYYNPDGTLEVTRNGQNYPGTWRVTERDRMCLKLRNSKEKCRIIVKQGDTYSKYIVKKNGQHQQSIRYQRFLPGRQF